jgi:transcriptional regulator with XRE-family HTH domain
MPWMQGVQKRLGKRIAELRRKKGFSQEGFAHECGFHRSYMGAVERGEKNITLVMVERVAKALKMSLAELFRGV